MSLKSAVAILVLTLAPAAVYAQDGCREHLQQTTAQCSAGQTWDAATQSCVTPISS